LVSLYVISLAVVIVVVVIVVVVVVTITCMLAFGVFQGLHSDGAIPLQRRKMSTGVST